MKTETKKIQDKRKKEIETVSSMKMCIRDSVYPDTLYEVLSQKNPVQFCSFKNRDRAKPTQKEYDSIQQVLDGKPEY